MKLTLESTDKLIKMVVDGHEVPARVWEGRSESGHPVFAFITQVALHEDAPPAEHAAWGRALQEHRKPTIEIFQRPIDMRFIL